MKNLSKFFMGAAALVLLTGCASLKKVDYKEFHEKAVAAAKEENGYTKAVVDGTMKTTSGGKTVEYKLDKVELTGLTNGLVDVTKLSLSDLTSMSEEKLMAMSIASMHAEDIGEANEEGAEVAYYVGNGFKASGKDKDGNESTLEYNKFGLLTSMKAKGTTEANLTVKWSK